MPVSIELCQCVPSPTPSMLASHIPHYPPSACITYHYSIFLSLHPRICPPHGHKYPYGTRALLRQEAYRFLTSRIREKTNI